jgi:hypothetical protein
MLIFVAMRFEVTLVLAYAISKTTEGFEVEMKKEKTPDLQKHDARQKKKRRQWPMMT